ALTCLGQVIWVDADERHPVLQSHRRVNGRIAFVRDGRVVCAQGTQEISAPMPHSMEHWAVHEWLAVTAAGWAMGWPLSVLEMMAQQANTSNS
ncbi:MAG: hypothetical protein ACN6NT_01495, partial [Comamonas sp.]